MRMLTICCGDDKKNPNTVGELIKNTELRIGENMGKMKMCEVRYTSLVKVNGLWVIHLIPKC